MKIGKVGYKVRCRRELSMMIMIINLALLGMFSFVGVVAAEPQPEVKIYRSEMVEPGFALITSKGKAWVKLVNLEGEVINRWHVDSPRVRLLPNGNLLALHGTNVGPERKRWNELRNVIREYSWDGKVVWETQVGDLAHHDVQRLPNGNTIFLVRYMLSDVEKEKVTDPIRRQQPFRSDDIVEVNTAGEVVWQWKAHEHLDVNTCGARPCDAPRPNLNLNQEYDWSHLNTVSIVPENKWYDNGDARFKPGNILTFPRSMWEAIMIDRSTKEVVWRYTGDYRGGLDNGHEPIMIPKGFPGAGNILIFDNGRKKHRGESVILEINPVSQELVWKYENGKEFFSRARGAVQRLKNGNTLISEDNRGRCFEVNTAGEIVWLYQEDGQTNRCSKYAPDFAPQFMAGNS